METVAYIVDKGGPAALENCVDDIRESGLTIAILGMLHVGWSDPQTPDMKVGDLIYNDYPGWPTGKRGNLLVSECRFNPRNDAEIAKWPAQVARLKQNSSVRKVLLSLGGAAPPYGPPDFSTIQNDLDFGRDPRFTQNIKALKRAVPAIDGIDFDCEEGGIKVGTFVGLGELFSGLGLMITFCPFVDADTWRDRMQTLQDGGMTVSWWNLQCYAGGGGNLNDLQPWIDALNQATGGNGASRLVPGLVAAGTGDVSSDEWQCPNQMADTIRGWNVPNLRGLFLWKYDGIGETPNVCTPPNSPLNPKLRDYVGFIDN